MAIPIPLSTEIRGRQKYNESHRTSHKAYLSPVASPRNEDSLINPNQVKVISLIENRCVGCSLCVPACPENALTCYGRLTIGAGCTDCLICIDTCPHGALQEPGYEERPPGDNPLKCRIDVTR
jgi:ferredoxin